jgi:mannose/fructose/sorbose-specific phosphotransferase system IIA component
MMNNPQSFGILICGHSDFPDGLKSACEIIMGEQEDLLTFKFTFEEDPVQFSEKMKAAASQFEQGCVFLADIVGGSPYNAALMCIAGIDDYYVIGGANLPILLELLSLRNNNSYPKLDIHSTIEELKMRAKDCIKFTCSQEIFGKE